MRYILVAAGIAVTFALGWIYGRSSTPTEFGTYLRDTFSDSRTTAAVASAIFALLTLGVQYLVGSRQAVIGTRQAEASRFSAEAAMLTANNAGNRAVASMRIGWIENLRKTLSEYHSILVTIDPLLEADQRRLSDLGTQIDLMLNLNEPSQKALWDIADKIYRLNRLEERKALDFELTAAGRAVMKAEWEKIKRELRGASGSG